MIDTENNGLFHLLPKRIAQLRKQRGLTQSQLANKIGIAQETVSAYERGKERPGIATVVKLSIVLDASTDFLLGLAGEERPQPKLNDLLNACELEVIETFRKLPYLQRERVVGYLHCAADHVKK